jgi:hypothetical protein
MTDVPNANAFIADPRVAQLEDRVTTVEAVVRAVVEAADTASRQLSDLRQAQAETAGKVRGLEAEANRVAVKAMEADLPVPVVVGVEALRCDLDRFRTALEQARDRAYFDNGGKCDCGACAGCICAKALALKES